MPQGHCGSAKARFGVSLVWDSGRWSSQFQLLQIAVAEVTEESAGVGGGQSAHWQSRGLEVIGDMHSHSSLDSTRPLALHKRRGQKVRLVVSRTWHLVPSTNERPDLFQQ